MRKDLNIHLYKLNGNGGVEILPAIKSNVDPADWVHIEGSSKLACRWISENYHLDAMSKDHLNAKVERPKLRANKKNIIVFLQEITKPTLSDINPNTIRFYINNDLLITISEKPSKVINKIAKELELGKGVANMHEMSARIALKITAEIEKTASFLENMLNNLEKKIVINDSDSFYNKLGKIRKRSLMLRYSLIPQKMVIGRLASLSDSVFTPETQRDFDDIYSFIQTQIDEIDVIRDRCQMLQSELFNKTADTTNKHIHSLSIISAVFMPATFLTGLLGVNLNGIWFADEDMSFSVYTILIFFVIFSVLFIFKKLKWF